MTFHVHADLFWLVSRTGVCGSIAMLFMKLIKKDFLVKLSHRVRLSVKRISLMENCMWKCVPDGGFAIIEFPHHATSCAS